MLIIQHRRNTTKELRTTGREYGVEIDIRSKAKDLILTHDPFTEGELLREWIKNYKHKILILNVKEEGLEERCIEIMNENGIDEFFFLDQSFPFLLKTVRMGEKRCAVRFSEYEKIDTVLSLQGLAKWVWVDIFSICPLNSRNYALLKEKNFNLCLVSPELQNNGTDEINKLKEMFKETGIQIDAVCTKYPKLWLDK